MSPERSFRDQLTSVVPQRWIGRYLLTAAIASLTLVILSLIAVAATGMLAAGLIIGVLIIGCSTIIAAVALDFVQELRDRREYTEELERLALYDPLTGLANRRLFVTRVDAHLRELAPNPYNVTILYLDLDRFKAINDALGHEAGDELLMMVAGRLRACLREQDTLAHMGGDEFAVLLGGVSEDHAATVALRVIERFRVPFGVRGYNIVMSVSIGAASFMSGVLGASELVRRAEAAMFQAKDRAGERFQLYQPGLESAPRSRLQLEAELYSAIERGELALYYQPIHDLNRGVSLRAEALVRWNHPERGLVQPSEFIPAAEECGLIRSIDRWVLRTAITQIGVWARTSPITVTVNVSAESLREPGLSEYVRHWLNLTEAPAKLLTIEVTESVAMRDMALARRVLEELRSLGVSIALDDFGSGYASFSYLKQLPVDVMKIDRSFVRGLGRDARDEGMLRALLAMGKGLGLSIVAEGVEDDLQLAWLRAAGCDHAQGYLIGYPMPAEHLDLRPRPEMQISGEAA